MVVEGKREHVPETSSFDAQRQFLDDNVGLKIGLNNFKELRAQNVILAGASGSHNVCLCHTTSECEVNDRGL